MFVLRQGDTNTHQSEQEGEGDLNADYVARTDKFLKNYETTDSDGRPIKMGKRRNADGEEESYPTFSLSQLGDCSKANNYGYVVKDAKDLVKPCIFIKLNTIWGWVPKPYDCDKEKGEDSEGRCLPDIEKHLAKQGADKNNFVYINCRGRYAADQEALADGLQYFPENQGLPISYFPYVGKGAGAGGNYHAPLVAVKITPKKGSEGQLIHIECRAYYDGVKHITKTKEGMVMFELQIKDE